MLKNYLPVRFSHAHQDLRRNPRSPTQSSVSDAILEHDSQPLKQRENAILNNKMADIPWYEHNSSDMWRLKGKNRGWLTKKAEKKGFKKEMQQALFERGIQKHQHHSVTNKTLINALIKFKNDVSEGSIQDPYLGGVKVENPCTELDESDDADDDADDDELVEALNQLEPLLDVEEDEVEEEENTLLWGLQGIGRAGLENIAKSVAGLQTLRYECRLRNIRVRENASAKTCINALIKFKNRYKRCGLPQEPEEPVYDQTLGDDGEEEEEEDGVDDGLEVDSSSISNDSQRISEDFSLPWDLKGIRKDYLEKLATKEGGKEFLRLACARRQLPKVRKNATSKVCITALIKWRKKKNKPQEDASIEDDQVDAEDIDEDEEPDAHEKLELEIVTEVKKTLSKHKPCSAQRIQHVLDIFKSTLSQMLQESRNDARLQAELRSLSARLKKANMDIAQMEQNVAEIQTSQNKNRKKIIKIPDKRMDQRTYARHLKKLLGADAIEGQHVFHIIAREHGGADHPHNYLYCLNGKFNQIIGSKYDDFNCFLAGLEKAKKAIEISQRLGNTPKKGKPHKKYAWKYSSVVEVESKRLYGEGQKFFTAARALRKTSC